MDSQFDIFVIGGGINGVSVARDAAGWGYSVALAEMNDLASGTSSKATKLVHGGLVVRKLYDHDAAIFSRMLTTALSSQYLTKTISP